MATEFSARTRQLNLQPREHEIWTMPSGLVTIAGGKLTTYRSMAEELLDKVAKRLRDQFNVAAPNLCLTAKTPITEGNGARVSTQGFPQDLIEDLEHTDGPQYPRVLKVAQRDPKLAQRIVEGLP